MTHHPHIEFSLVSWRTNTSSPLAMSVPFPVQFNISIIAWIIYLKVWCGVLSAGPDGTVLNSSFRCRSDPKYLSSLGQSIINIIRVVPHGVLVFFPSYRSNSIYSKTPSLNLCYQPHILAASLTTSCTWRYSRTLYILFVNFRFFPHIYLTGKG